MSWYTAECLYYAKAGPDVAETLAEYRYFLLEATSDEVAKTKAWQLAKSHEHSYMSAEGREVKWVLEAVIDVQDILADKLSEGTELYHKYFDRRIEEPIKK